MRGETDKTGRAGTLTAAKVRPGGGRRFGPLLLAAAAALALSALLPKLSPAQEIKTGIATEYVVTVSAVNLCGDPACATKFGLGSGSKSFDIANGAVGGEVGAFGDISSLPIGVTVSHIQVQFSRSFTVTGSVSMGNGSGTTCFTDSAQSLGSIVTPTPGKDTGPAGSQTIFIPNVGAFGGEPTQAAYDAVGLILEGPSAASGILPLTAPFTVTGSPPKVKIGFRTQNALGAVLVSGNCVMLIQPPGLTISIE